MVFNLLETIQLVNQAAKLLALNTFQEPASCNLRQTAKVTTAVPNHCFGVEEIQAFAMIMRVSMPIAFEANRGAECQGFIMYKLDDEVKITSALCQSERDRL